MKLSNDIKSIIEDDVKHLTEAMLTGEISPLNWFNDPCTLSTFYSEQAIHKFAADILQYQLNNKSLSLILPYLSTMKWLTLSESCIYARCSRNTLLNWIENGKIYASKPDGSGTYIIDRESIDNYFNALRDNVRIRSKELRMVG